MTYIVLLLLHLHLFNLLLVHVLDSILVLLLHLLLLLLFLSHLLVLFQCDIGAGGLVLHFLLVCHLNSYYFI